MTSIAATAPADLAAKTGPRVGLFVTCLVDLFRPSVGFAALKLLEDAGCTVEVPASKRQDTGPGMPGGMFRTR